MILFNFTFYSIVCLTFIILVSKRDMPVVRAGIIIYTVLTVLWLWITLSFREPRGDPWRYMLGLNIISDLSFIELLNYDKDPFGFRLLNWVTALFSTNSIVFFSVTYFLCIVPLYLAFRERVSKTDASILMMLYLLYPFYINYIGSGFKQGIAFGFMFWGLASIFDREKPIWKKGIVLLFIATLFHSSFWLANLGLALWYFALRKKPLIWSLIILGLCIAIAFLNIAESVVSVILPENIVDQLGFSTYFDEEFLNSDEYLSVGYTSGFRLDFTLFTLIPIFLFFLLNKSIYKESHGLDFLKFYCIMASIYFLLVFIPYSDRIASFSWFLIPFLVYNYLSRTTHKKYLTSFIVIMISIYPLLMITYTKGFFK